MRMLTLPNKSRKLSLPMMEKLPLKKKKNQKLLKLPKMIKMGLLHPLGLQRREKGAKTIMRTQILNLTNGFKMVIQSYKE